jgi:hypothetical protein
MQSQSFDKNLYVFQEKHKHSTLNLSRLERQQAFSSYYWPLATTSMGHTYTGLLSNSVFLHGCTRDMFCQVDMSVVIVNGAVVQLTT